MTWSYWQSSWKPGMPFANSTTSRTAGVKHWEKDSHTCWLETPGADTGHAFSGQACDRDGIYYLNVLLTHMLNFHVVFRLSYWIKTYWLCSQRVQILYLCTFLRPPPPPPHTHTHTLCYTCEFPNKKWLAKKNITYIGFSVFVSICFLSVSTGFVFLFVLTDLSFCVNIARIVHK